MSQPISGHIVRLLPGHDHAIVLLDNMQEIPVSCDCMPTGMFERLRVGDRVWYFSESGEGAYNKRSGRVFPISSRYGANYNIRIVQSAVSANAGIASTAGK